MKYFTGFYFMLLLIFLLLSGASSVFADAETIIGSSEQEVVEIMGEPLGRAVSGNDLVLQYSSKAFLLQDNKVVELINTKTNNVKSKPVKSLTSEKNNLKTAFQKYKLSAKKSDKYKRIKVIDSNGQRVNPDVLEVPNRITIVYFYANWCGLCDTINPKIEKLVRKYREICLRKVNIMNENTPLARQFNIVAVPSLRVYNREGDLVGSPPADFDKIESYVERLILHK